MSTPKSAPTSVPVAPTVAPPVRPETFTNWRALAQAKLVPVRIECQAYPVPGQNFQDSSCHSKLAALEPSTFIRHMENDHGGKFKFYLRKGEGKPSPLWEELMTSGLEAGDFRCEICNQALRFHATSFDSHAKQHRGQSKRAYDVMRGDCPDAQALFNVSLGFRRPDPTPEDLDTD